MEQLKLLATKALALLDELEEQREAFRQQYGDERGAYYRGNMSGDLRRLAQGILVAAQASPPTPRRKEEKWERE